MQVKMLLRGFMLLLLAGLLVITGCNSEKNGASSTETDNYPNKTITIIVPNAAGGSTDATSRAVASSLEKIMGTPVIIENVPGSSGLIGFTKAFSADADGYTILCVDMPSMQIGELINDGQYKTTDWSFLANAILRGHVVAVSQSSPYKTFEDLIEMSNTKTLLCSTTGVGSASSIAELVLINNTEIQMRSVPFDSGAEAIAAVLGGQTDFTISGVESMAAAIDAGEARALAVFTPERIDVLPDVPTLPDLGYPESFFLSRGFLAPPGLPGEILSILEESLLEAFKSPDTAKQLSSGATLLPLSSSDYEQHAKEMYDIVLEYKDDLIKMREGK